MRALILVAAAALAACGKNDQAGNTANVDAGLSAETISANDVTAIDAVTGEAANMAADVNYINEVDENGGGNLGTAPSNRATPKRPSSAGAATTNTTAPATAAVNNSAE